MTTLGEGEMDANLEMKTQFWDETYKIEDDMGKALCNVASSIWSDACFPWGLIWANSFIGVSASASSLRLSLIWNFESALLKCFYFFLGSFQDKFWLFLN